LSITKQEKEGLKEEYLRAKVDKPNFDTQLLRFMPEAMSFGDQLESIFGKERVESIKQPEEEFDELFLSDVDNESAK
jgi:molecular chaperone GrpE (heat shock protein)